MLPYVVLAHGAVIAEGAEERFDRRVHLDVFVVRHGHAEHLETKENQCQFGSYNIICTVTLICTESTLIQILLTPHLLNLLNTSTVHL